MDKIKEAKTFYAQSRTSDVVNYHVVWQIVEDESGVESERWLCDCPAHVECYHIKMAKRQFEHLKDFYKLYPEIWTFRAGKEIEHPVVKQTIFRDELMVYLVDVEMWNGMENMRSWKKRCREDCEKAGIPREEIRWFLEKV